MGVARLALSCLPSWLAWALDLAGRFRPWRVSGGESGRADVPAGAAVAPNSRRGKANLPGRAWYMLPSFVDRHRPLVLVPRVNHHAPIAVANRLPPYLVDANFSTVWTNGGDLDRLQLLALLN